MPDVRAARIPGRIPGRRLRPILAAAVLICAIPVALPAPAHAQTTQNTATVQWAQQVLEQGGFYNGRAHGRMDAATATAISNYQKSLGLRATGRLDQATIDRMLADREGQENPTVGNLADPTNRARPSAPIVKEEDVIPRAAPVAPGVQAVGPAEGGETPPSDAIAAPGTANPPGSGVEQPRAAARAGVEVEGGANAQEPALDIKSLVSADWVRYGLIALVGGVLALMAGVWAFSGRRRRSAKPRPGKPRGGDQPVRREPTLGGPPAADGRRDPFFPSAGGSPQAPRRQGGGRP